MILVVLIFIGIVFLFTIILLAKTFVIVPQGTEYNIQRLGKYSRTLDSGFSVITPFVDVIAGKISIKERVADFLPQPVITKDNVTMNIDTVVYYQVTDSFSYQYKVDNAMKAIENLTATTVRNLVGDLTLDQTLTSRDVVNAKMRAVLDEATDPWGIKVNRVELKNIQPPKDVTDAMEKESKAERVKRATILEAESFKQSAVLKAQGEKESAILSSQGQRESQILRAQGEAQAIVEINAAKAKALELIKDVHVDEAVIQLKSLEALEKLGDGQATKIFLPAELSGIASMTTAFGELNEKMKPTTVNVNEVSK